MKKIVAIHQPNFLPWMGFFDKCLKADVLVLLDSVQFPKTGGTWTNRVKIRVGNKASWMTVPVDRSYHGKRQISDIAIRDDLPWRVKCVQTIKHSYAKCPHFDEVIELIEEMIMHQDSNLCQYNISNIHALIEVLGITGKHIVCSSQLNLNSSATDMLVEIVGRMNGTAYLCGNGAAGYQIDAKFEDAGIDLIYQSFSSPTYFQRKGEPFIPGLSIIDCLFSCGIAGTKEYMRKCI